METESRTASQIIDDLGGTKVVSTELGCEMPVVSNWRKSKIPALRWPAMVGLFPKGPDRPKGVTYEELAAQLPPAEDEAAA